MPDFFELLHLAEQTKTSFELLSGKERCIHLLSRTDLNKLSQFLQNLPLSIGQYWTKQGWIKEIFLLAWNRLKQDVTLSSQTFSALLSYSTAISLSDIKKISLLGEIYLKDNSNFFVKCCLFIKEETHASQWNENSENFELYCDILKNCLISFNCIHPALSKILDSSIVFQYSIRTWQEPLVLRNYLVEKLSSENISKKQFENVLELIFCLDKINRNELSQLRELKDKIIQTLEINNTMTGRRHLIHSWLNNHPHLWDLDYSQSAFGKKPKT